MKQEFNLSQITNKTNYIRSLLESKIGTDVLFLTVLPNKGSLCYDYPYISISKGNKSICNRDSLFRRLFFKKGHNIKHNIVLNEVITGSVLMIIFQDRQSINVNETSNELQ